MFRYNDPVEAEKLRKGGCHSSSLNLSRLSLLSWSTNDLTQSSESLQLWWGSLFYFEITMDDYYFGLNNIKFIVEPL